MSITIEEKEKIKDFVKFFKEFIDKLDIAKEVEMGSPIQQPTFSVGMRVECVYDGASSITEGMVYRIKDFDEEDNSFSLVDDDGEKEWFDIIDLRRHFIPYEKPKEGDEYWNLFLNSWIWSDNEKYYKLWNLGLAFKTKEQATFARERLSKLF